MKVHFVVFHNARDYLHVKKSCRLLAKSTSTSKDFSHHFKVLHFHLQQLEDQTTQETTSYPCMCVFVLQLLQDNLKPQNATKISEYDYNYFGNQE